MNFRRIILFLLRLTLAGVFIFSGFVKAVDPWGTAIKIGEYATALGFGGLGNVAFALSVLLSAGELTLGLATLFGVKRRLIGCLTFLFMIGFTTVTLWSALKNPVADCGCFGDAVKLTNWQTFYKNLILLPIALIVWLVPARRKRSSRSVTPLYDTTASTEIYTHSPGGYRRQCEQLQRIRRLRREWTVLLSFFVLACGVGIYALLYLPPVDFLPFKVGVNIPEAMGEVAGGEVKTTLTYRDRTDGTLHEFSLSDTTWYDETRWVYVDTHIAYPGGALREPAIREFAIFDAREDITDLILHNQGRVYLLCVTDPSELSERCSAAFGRVADEARAAGAAVYAITPAPLGNLPRIETPVLSDSLTLSEMQPAFAAPAAMQFEGAAPVPAYNIDGTTLKTMLRARAGLVVLEGGTILEKKNCRSLR